MIGSRYLYLVKLPLIAAMFVLVAMGVFAKRGWMDWQRMVRQNHDLGTKIAAVRKEKADLERQLVALKSDAAEQERVIRQTLGYVKPNETVIEFP